VVAQHETFSPANQYFLMELRTLCDFVLHTYLSKIADTAEKRNYFHVVYTTADTLPLVSALKPFRNDIPQILRFYPPTSQPCRNPRILLDARHVADYLNDFLWDPERSKLFYYDPGMWNAVVGARCMRYLWLPTSNLR